LVAKSESSFIVVPLRIQFYRLETALWSTTNSKSFQRRLEKGHWSDAKLALSPDLYGSILGN